MEICIYSINDKFVLNVENDTNFSDFLEKVFTYYDQHVGYPRYDKNLDLISTIRMTFYNVSDATHTTSKTIQMTQTIAPQTLESHNVSNATNCFIRVNVSG
jgi:hypothetical protein